MADAGISALVLVGYCLVSAGAAVYLVSARQHQEKRLQLLCGVTPVMYWSAALAADMIVSICTSYYGKSKWGVRQEPPPNDVLNIQYYIDI